MKNEAPEGRYWDTWTRWECPGCKKLNWVCEGNVQDLSGDDTESCECWSCGIKFWVADDMKHNPEDYGGEIDEQGEDWIEVVYCRKGREKP